MNIAIITLVTPSTNSGLGQYIKHLIHALQKVDSKNKYFIIANSEFANLVEINRPNFRIIKVDIPHYPRLIMRPLYFIWQNSLVFFLYRHLKIHLVHIPNPIPLFTTFRIPTVVTIHDVAELRNKRFRGIRRKFRAWVTKLSSRKATNVLTVSNFSKQEIHSSLNLDTEKIFVTHLASTFSIENGPIAQKKEIIPYLLHVGGANSNKNIQVLIDAFLRIRNEFTIKLKIVGDRSSFKSSLSNFDKLEKEGVMFMGYLTEEELELEYKNCLIFVYPSLYEGFGLPVLEAMSKGVPVITSDVTSMPEIVGDAALLIDPYSSKELVNTLTNILSSRKLRKEFTLLGLKRARKFSWKNTAIKTVSVYEKSLE